MADAPSKTVMHLGALGGAAAPPSLAGDLAQLARFSETARDAFWSFLAPNLAGKVDEGLGAVAARFCQEHDVPQEALVGLVRGCRALFRPAALADVAVATVTIDLNQLCGEHPGIVKRLSEWYGQALPRVRVEAMLGSLDDFGAVLDDVRVRKQYLPTSKHAPSVLTPLSTMTLFYREAGEEKRVTLQLTPDTLALLRARCDTLTE